MTTEQFTGFSPDASDFFGELQFNNNRTWFEANKRRYAEQIQSPAQAFVEALGARLQSLSPNIRFDTRLNGSGSIMRIYRDVRFSADKSPYKTNLGVTWWEGVGKKTEQPGYYFHLDVEGGWLAGGLYQFDKPTMQTYQRAVDAEASGARLQTIVSAIRSENGFRVGGEQYARVPRSYAADHPRADLLRHKGLIAGGPPVPDAILHSAELVDYCFAQCRVIQPLIGWLVELTGSTV